MPDLLYLLAVLACPVSMAAMMWFMSRSHRRQQDDPTGLADKQAELAHLQAQIDRLRAQQATGDPARHGSSAS